MRADEAVKSTTVPRLASLRELKGKLGYLAAPYTSRDPGDVEARAAAMCRADARLMKAGIFTVSPLLKHLTLQHAELPSDWAYWKDYSTTLMQRVDFVAVLMLQGWRESTGVQAELALAERFNLPVMFIYEEIEEGSDASVVS